MKASYYVAIDKDAISEQDIQRGVSLVIRGKCIDTSVNANLWQVSSEGLDLIARELEGVPLMTDHNVSVYNVVGQVIRSVRDGDSVLFEAEVIEPNVALKILKGLIKYVSVSVEPEKTLCSVCGKETRVKGVGGEKFIHICPSAYEIVHNPHVRELSLVVFPAYKDTKIEPLGFMAGINELLKERVIENVDDANKGSGEGLQVSASSLSNISETVDDGSGTNPKPELSLERGEVGMEAKVEPSPTVAQEQKAIVPVVTQTDDKGRMINYEELLTQLEKKIKQLVEEAVKKALEAEAKKAGEVKANAEEKSEEIEEAKKYTDEAKVVRGGLVAAFPSQKEHYPDWLVELLEAAKKAKGMQ